MSSIVHAMVDLEALSNVPSRGALLAIGAQAFQLSDDIMYPLPEDFEVCVKEKKLYYPIDITSQISLYGFDIEADTLSWWLDPKRIDYFQAFMHSSHKVDIRTAFDRFALWLHQICPKQEFLRLWSHGVTYDCMHLEQKWQVVMQTSFNKVCPFRSMRDTRTLFAVYEEKFGRSPYTITQEQRKHHHHPLEDAWVQAKAVQNALKGLLND